MSYTHSLSIYLLMLVHVVKLSAHLSLPRTLRRCARRMLGVYFVLCQSTKLKINRNILSMCNTNKHAISLKHLISSIQAGGGYRLQSTSLSQNSDKLYGLNTIVPSSVYLSHLILSQNSDKLYGFKHYCTYDHLIDLSLSL